MLTPEDITGKVFEKAVFGGYDAKEVDRFLRELADELTAVLAERDELKNRIRFLAEKIEEYKEGEYAVQQALVGAQKSANELLGQVEKQRNQRLEEIRRETEQLIARERAKNERIIAEETAATEAKLAELRTKLESEEKNYAEVQKRSSSYVAELLSSTQNFEELLRSVYGSVLIPEEEAEPAEAVATEVEPAEAEAAPPAEGVPVPEAEESREELIDRTVSAVAGIVRRSYSSADSAHSEKAEWRLPDFALEDLRFGDKYRKKRT